MQLNCYSFLVWIPFCIFTINRPKRQVSKGRSWFNPTLVYFYGQSSLRGFCSPASGHWLSPALHPFVIPHPPLPWHNFFWDRVAKCISAKITGVKSARFWRALLLLFAAQPCKRCKDRTERGWAGTPGEKTWLKEVSCDNLLKHIPLYRNFTVVLLPDSLIHLLNRPAGGMKIRIKVLLQWMVNCARRNGSKKDRDWKKTSPTELNTLAAWWLQTCLNSGRWSIWKLTSLTTGFNR